MEAVNDCARSSTDPAASRSTRSSREQTSREQASSDEDGDGQAGVKLETVQRFVSAVPSLRRLLSAPVHSAHEALLRSEMRRTIGALCATLDEAARAEGTRTSAAVLRAASSAAAQLTAQPARERRSSERDH